MSQYYRHAKFVKLKLQDSFFHSKELLFDLKLVLPAEAAQS